jgi:2-isopropylmalate synthase
MARIQVLDSTLRDGAQSEGVSFSVTDKLDIVRTLDTLGVDIIEAGNPGSNPKDSEFFREARRLSLTHARLAAFGPTRRKGVDPDHDEGLATLMAADTDTVVIFGKSWDLHVTEVLRASLAENIAMIGDTVAWLRERGKRVVYDAEHFFDGWKANPDYALRTLAAAAAGGAECLVLCDTNGGSLPWEIEEATAKALSFGVPLGIHAHNDTGLATANSLAAVRAGAVHIQGTLIGFGERCGNANLSTVIGDLVLKMGHGCLPDGSLARIAGAGRRIAEIANIVMDDSMPYIGRKAFAHKAGMHVDAVVKTPKSFEHVQPEAVGNERRFLASEVGGRSAIIDRVRKIDAEVTKDSPLLADVLGRLKEMEHLGYSFEGADASLELLTRRMSGRVRPFFRLVHYRTINEQPAHDLMRCAQATVTLEVDGVREIAATEGDGPVHALDLALRKALLRFYPAIERMRLTDYKVRVLSSDATTAAKVRVLIQSTDGETSWNTVGVSTDIIEASRIALVDSIEYKLYKEEPA